MPKWREVDGFEDVNRLWLVIWEDFVKAEDALRSVKEDEQVTVSFSEEVAKSWWFKGYKHREEAQITVPYGLEMRDELRNRFDHAMRDDDLSRQARLLAAAEYIKAQDYMSTRMCRQW